MVPFDARQRELPFEGLSPVQVESSRQEHGWNILTPPPRTPWWKLYLEKFDDPVIRILIIAAVIALVVGATEGHYAEGFGIVVAILLATTLSFINEYKAGREFDILNRVSDEVPVNVIRAGDFATVPRKDLVVGDVVLLEMGEEVPADGRLLEVVSLRLDESPLTGESLPVKKRLVPAEPEQRESAYPEDRVFRGTLVKDGHGIMEVTAVGDATEIGRLARPAYQDIAEKTPLVAQLEELSKVIGVVGFLVAGTIFAALVTRGVLVRELTLTQPQWGFMGILGFSVLLASMRVWLPIVYDALELAHVRVSPPFWLAKEHSLSWVVTLVLGLATFSAGVGILCYFGILPVSPGKWVPHAMAEEFLRYFMISVTIIVVAVPEGLAMSVTLSLAYSMRKMTASNNLVRRMHACETIGAATVICTDKTGTLTLNEMRVYSADFPCLKDKLLFEDPHKLTYGEEKILEGISVNSTAHVSEKTDDATPHLIGNPTECALLLWLKDLHIDYMQYRAAFSVSSQWTFSTERKYMGTMGTSSVNGEEVLHLKGAPEVVLDRCSRLLTGEGVRPIDGYREDIAQALKGYQACGMRTLGLAYRENPSGEEDAEIEEIARDMIWLGFVAIADPIRPEVPDALRACLDAGIGVKIVTGDNPETAREIARQVGLWEEGDTEDRIMTGKDFAQLSDERAGDVAVALKILSRARPMDKLRLVTLLQEKGEVVAVTGDGTNDAPALSRAHVGLAMGKTGTSVAKEASDIILLDDSFRSITNAVMWGRSLYENIQRFILFQLTINVVALCIALLGPFIGVKLPLTVTQMLWVNLIMDTFAALALATEPPHWNVMRRQPRNPKDFIVSKTMAKTIFTVAPLFLVFLVWFLLEIQRRGNVNHYDLSMFFTVFVMLQFWNLFNARCLGQNSSAFADILKNKAFLCIAAAIFLGQVLITQFGGSFFRTVPLTLVDWLRIVVATSVVLWIGELWRLACRMKARLEDAATG